MSSSVVRLGAWCDFETEDEARQRLLTEAAAADDGQVDAGYGPWPGRYDPLSSVPVLSPGGISFRVEEFAVLADERRIRLHAERGFTLSGGVDPWQGLTLGMLESSVRTTVLPDDAEETGEDHPWEWLAELLHGLGIEAGAAQLRDLPYDVEFSDRLRARVSAGT